MHQLGIHLSDAFHVHVHDADGHGRLLLHAVEHLEAAAATVAAQRVRGVGNVLELGQDETGHQHGRPDEAGLRHVGDAAIYDDAGVKQQHFFAGPLAPSAAPSQPDYASSRTTYEREEIAAAQGNHRDAHVAENDRHDGGQNAAEWGGQVREGKAARAAMTSPITRPMLPARIWAAGNSRTTRRTHAAGFVVSQGAMIAPSTAPAAVRGRIYLARGRIELRGACQSRACHPTDDTEKNKSNDTKNDIDSHVGYNLSLIRQVPHVEARCRCCAVRRFLLLSMGRHFQEQ